MLVLARHRNERVIIGHGANQFVITVVDIRSDKVRFGIEGPRAVEIHREEVWDRLYPDEPVTPTNPEQ